MYYNPRSKKLPRTHKEYEVIRHFQTGIYEEDDDDGAKLFSKTFWKDDCYDLIRVPEKRNLTKEVLCNSII